VAGHTVAIQFVRAALVLAMPGGLDVRRVLREAGIAPALIGQDAARVTGAQATHLIQALWTATDDELIGIGPKPVPRGTVHMVSLGLIHTPDLRTALKRFIQFAGIGMGFDVTELADDGRTTQLCFKPGRRTQSDQLVIAIGMAVGHRFAGWLVGQQIVLSSVELPSPAPPHAAEYPLIFGVAPTFESPRASITFDSRYLSAPLVRSEEELIAFIRSLPNELLFRQDYNPSTSSRVRKMIERRSSAESVTVDDVARPLNISAQHLRRLLREEGTTFRQIKEDILRDEAIAGLVRGNETIEELSNRLGFSEPSAFRRAFRRWTGSPPGSYLPVQ
jgi:AraC-like DNA-binding protein